MRVPEHSPYVSRAGLKLQHALGEFGVDPADMICADFGCNVGGFTDCLLQHGAAKVYAIDTGYGVLAWKLRQDPRVVVMERTNALHAQSVSPQPRHGESPAETSPEGKGSGVDVVVIDLGWTPQRLAVPAALRWLKPDGRIITLIKPHYELTGDERATLLIDGVIDEVNAERIFQRSVASFGDLAVEALQTTRSPIRGGKSSKGHQGAGNIEFLALLKRAASRS